MTSRRIALSEQPLIETGLAAALGVSHGMILNKWFDPWSSVGETTRQVIYQTGAGVVAVIASLAAIGLATGGAGERGRALRRLYGAELRRNWRALLMTSALAPMLVIVAMIADANGAGWAPYLFEAAIIWTCLRLLRLAWLVDGLLAKQVEDEAAVDRRPAAEPSEDFERRIGVRTVGRGAQG